jgi:hypothetical protein
MSSQRLGHGMIANPQLRPRLWPGFRRQPQAPPEPATRQVQPQPTQPLSEETHHAPPLWALAPASGVGRRHLQTGRRQAVPVGLFDAGPIGQHPEHRHGQHQPVPGDADGLRAPRLLPLPTHPFEGPEPHLNGTITNDKFCMTRTGWLHLTWWRRPLRSRPAGADVSGYPSDETSRRGGTHETSVDNPPSVP